MSKRIAVVGTRAFPTNLRHLIRDYIQKLPKDSVIVSGGARGVDSWAVEDARTFGLQYIEYLPQKYDDNGKYRGPKAFFDRNKDIVNDATEVVAFWDGSSTGTKDTIDYARRKGLPVTIYYTDGRIDDPNNPVPDTQNTRRTFADMPEKPYRPLMTWIKAKQNQNE